MQNILTDIAAMAKAGYTPTEVKEILALAKADAADSEKPAETGAKTSPQPEPEKENGKTETGASEKTQDADDKKADAKDDKESEIEKLKAQIKKLEETNASKDVSGDISKNKNDDLLNMVRSFM